MEKWTVPADKSEVKSFLQTVQFSLAFMRPSGGWTYTDVTAPLRQLTKKNVKFRWSEECEEAFQIMKQLLVSDQVMGCYDPKKEV